MTENLKAKTIYAGTIGSGLYRTSAQTANGDVKQTSVVMNASLSQNYPNPFGTVTVIGYNVSTASDVKLDIVDLSGRTVMTLFDGVRSPGSYTAEFDATSAHLPSGVYIARLVADGTITTLRIVHTNN